MVVSRYVGIVKAGETSRLATRDERGEREERVKIPVAGVFSFSSFFLPSFLPSFLSFTLLPPCIISPLASRDRGFHVFQTAGLFAPRNGCRTRLCKLYEARACPRPRREPPSFEPYRTDWTESGSWIIHGGRSMEWFVLHRGMEERKEGPGLDVFLTEEEQIMNRLFSIFPGFVCDIYFDNYFFPLRYYF